MKKGDSMKLKTFCIEKQTITRLKRLPQNGRKIFVNYSSDKPLISRNIGSSKKSAPTESAPH
jgi:hypothetical protein